VNRLCFLLLFPIFVLNTYCIELFKIPKLISHFKQHQALNNQISIIDFLNMHYFGEDIADNDHEEDMELPLKKIEAPSIIQFAVPVKRIFIQKEKYFVVLTKQPNSQSIDHNDPAPGCLFKPPKA